MMDLEFNRVSKKYWIERGSTSGAVPFPARRSSKGRQEFWALKDVSFQVSRGETLGIIGANGAGKSTILKLLSKITAPSSGEITIRGKLSALIEIGSGFHPELTGRENVYLSGSILGMRRREIAEKLESIVEFAGFPEFIDSPVKHYSSGMCVRLGFSIAAHLHPDILLLDEVLAVGDAAFQEKCFKRITKLRDSGITITFISHDLSAVEFLCDRVLLLRNGRIAANGDPRDVILQYQQDECLDQETCLPPTGKRDERKPVRITAVTFEDCEGRRLTHVRTGRPLVTQLDFKAYQFIEDVIFEVFYYSQDGKLQCQFSTAWNQDRIDLNSGAGRVQFTCEEFGLQPGSYYADATIRRRNGDEELDWHYRSAVLEVDSDKPIRGSFYVPHRWRIIQYDAPSPGSLTHSRFGRVGER